MTVVKTFRFSAGAEWQGGRLTRLSAPGKLTCIVSNALDVPVHIRVGTARRDTSALSTG